MAQGVRFQMGRLPEWDHRSCAQRLSPHALCGKPAPYRVHEQAAAGPVFERHLCTNHAAALALEHGHQFPPGMWRAV